MFCSYACKIDKLKKIQKPDKSYYLKLQFNVRVE